MEIFRRLSGQVLIDLREMEGDYRTFNLAIDKTQSIAYMAIACIALVGTLGIDILIFKDTPALFWQMVVYRVSFLVLTAVIILVMLRTNRVRTFDRLALSWIITMLVFLLIINLN